MYLIGFDIGSSSIKAALVDATTGQKVEVVQQPKTEMSIAAPHRGWAEQDPDTWWQQLCLASQALLQSTGVAPTEIKSIGIAYQMHGLVAVDSSGKPIRPSIIWCDSRAVEMGDRAFAAIGPDRCLSRLLNSPGNFTASKLAWVKSQEPERYERIHKIMLPGDYIAYRLTGEICSTISGLSEGVFWDFAENKISSDVLEHYGFASALMPTVVDTFAEQGRLSQLASEATGLAVGTPVTFRAGDQPNNAMSLNVLQPGEIAATGGTSGVIYGVVDRPLHDHASRVNGFAHVNHTPQQPRIGILLCINGAGIQYGWVKNQVATAGTTYGEMEALAGQVSVGSDELSILPFGNGAERIFQNKEIGAHVINLQLNQHGRAHLYRAALEGIAFSFVYGTEILKDMGLSLDIMRVGNDNLFQSTIFSSTIAHLTGAAIEIADSTGAVGAALASGVAIGAFSSVDEAQQNLQILSVIEPSGLVHPYQQAYARWATALERHLS